MDISVCVWLVYFAFFNGLVSSDDQPNVVFIIADDLGWYDVGIHGGNQIPTPNIDALAYNGIILNSHYVQPASTPTRAALLTGKYPFRLGLQGGSFLPADKRFLPEGKLLPGYFKDLGYSTHLVGKWHMGYSRWNETPTSRGFDHHFGYYNGFTSYFDYLTTWSVNTVFTWRYKQLKRSDKVEESNKIFQSFKTMDFQNFDNKEYTGFDLRKDGVPAFEEVGKYATDAFTEYTVKTIEEHDTSKPLFIMLAHLAVHAGNVGKQLESPQETINKFKHVEDSNRRTYAAMVSKLDDSVGSIVEALETKKILQNTIIVFISDNGAPTVGPEFRNWGSNYPLRGIKGTLFEGGIRSVALIYSPLLVQPGRVSTDLMHVTDWLPTLYSAVGADTNLLDPELDGIDQWSSLVYDLPSARNDILINLDEKTRNAALRFYNWKLIVGSSQNGSYNDYYGDVVTGDIEEQLYNSSAVYDSFAGSAIRKLNYGPLTEVEYEGLRKGSTIKCLDPKSPKNACDPSSGSLCLYDIPSDPCEENDLAKFFPSVVRRMKRALVDYRTTLVEQITEETDIDNANPKLFHHTWNPWLECADSECAIQ